MPAKIIFFGICDTTALPNPPLLFWITCIAFPHILCITLHCIALHYTALHCIALHCIALQGFTFSPFPCHLNPKFLPPVFGQNWSLIKFELHSFIFPLLKMAWCQMQNSSISNLTNIFVKGDDDKWQRSFVFPGVPVIIRHPPISMDMCMRIS